LNSARLEGELEGLRKSKEAPPAAAPEKIFQFNEVAAAVRAGQIDVADAFDYIGKKTIPALLDDALQTRELVQKSREPLRRAEQEINEYASFIPGIKEKGSVDFNKAVAKYRELVALGYHADNRTERVAVELAFGDLATLRRKHEQAAINAQPRTIPVDGGGGPTKSSGKLDISKASETMKADWDREGYDQATRERQYAIFLDLKARQRPR
jgi:hypothetical protein